MTLAISLPAINPEIFAFDLGGFTFALRWYAVSYIAGFLIARHWFLAFMRRPELWPEAQPPMNLVQPERLLTWIIIGAVAGGRIGYALIYNPAHYLESPVEVLKIWKGGMSFHGGFIGLIAATYLYCKKEGVPVAGVADTISIVCTPGLFLGRLANFVNMELWGRPSELPWAVVFPHGNAAICPLDWAGPCSRHPSQLYEALLEGLLLGMLLAWLAYGKKWLKTPGLLTGMFFSGYGASRFIVEFFRVPDEQFVSESNPLGHVVRLTESVGATMGQTLSVLMIAIGLAIILTSQRKDA